MSPLQLRILLTVLTLIVCALPVWGRFQRPVELLHRIGRRRRLAMGLVFVFSLAITATLAIWRGYPVAYVHDELSNMLAADTFAHGRLTNPTPAGWEHFESMHILVRPSYQTKYPPGQGLFMALGLVLFKQAAWGVWISAALAAVAACWMLYGFVSPPWALVGGLMMAMHPRILEWAQIYWGGCTAVLGGCLLLGGFGRITRCPAGMPVPRAPAAFWMAVGMIVLAISRPFEGFVLTLLLLPGLFLAIRRMLRDRHAAWAQILTRIAAPALIVLIAGGTWIAYYNYRVTGHPLRMPYQESQAQYGVVPLFIFSRMSPEPVYQSDAIRLFHVREQGYYYRYGNWRVIGREMVNSTVNLLIGAGVRVEIIVLPLLLLPWMFARNWRLRYLIVVLVLLDLAMATETYMFAHYAAPAAGLCAVLVVVAMRWMYRMGPRIGPLLVRCTIAVFIVSSACWWCQFFHYSNVQWAIKREAMAKELVARNGGKHIIFVRYDLRQPIVPWYTVAADVAADILRRPWLSHFAHQGLKGLPYLPEPLAGESRTIWLSENDMSYETHQTLYALWPDRDWWRLELHEHTDESVAMYRELADRYVRQQPGNHVVVFGDEDEDGRVVPGPIELRHLVTRHNVHAEWVYNAADLPNAPVIWARDLGDQKNRELMRSYADRKAWIINPDKDPDGPRPYVPGGPS